MPMGARNLGWRGVVLRSLVCASSCASSSSFLFRRPHRCPVWYGMTCLQIHFLSRCTQTLQNTHWNGVHDFCSARWIWHLFISRRCYAVYDLRRQAPTTTTTRIPDPRTYLPPAGCPTSFFHPDLSSLHFLPSLEYSPLNHTCILPHSILRFRPAPQTPDLRTSNLPLWVWEKNFIPATW